MMHKNYPGADLMMSALTPLPKGGKVVLDSASKSADASQATYAETDLRLKAGAALLQWAETPDDELGEGETAADRLLMLTVGIIDADKDGEISDDEQAVADVLLNAMWEYLSAKGASDEDCDALLNNWDADAATRVKDLLAETLPAGEEADVDLDSFAFDAEAEEAVFDAVYRKKVVVRGGKKMRINKRISGTVRLSAKQKIAVRKMQRKSHSAGAMIRRMKSLRVRKQSGL